MNEDCGMCDYLRFQLGAMKHENYTICKLNNDVTKRPSSTTCGSFKDNGGRYKKDM